jgi:hypothetical protein
MPVALRLWRDAGGSEVPDPFASAHELRNRPALSWPSAALGAALDVVAEAA